MARNDDRNPYAILGIPPNASTAQVRQAYHRLARLNHPDLNTDPNAGERMKDINWAYNILRDPEKRSHYDLWGNGVSPVVFYGGTKSPRREPTSPRPASTSSSKSGPGHPYSSPRPATASPVERRTLAPVAWLIIIGLVTLMRAILQTAQFPLGIANIATQTARMDRMTWAMQTMQASQGSSPLNGTPLPLAQTPPIPSPAVTGLIHEYEDEYLRSVFVPGSWEWEQLHRYFPHLTTPIGLSDEVIRVIYDELQGYQIKTHSSGDYWLFIDRYDQSVMPAHFPP